MLFLAKARVYLTGLFFSVQQNVTKITIYVSIWVKQNQLCGIILMAGSNLFAIAALYVHLAIYFKQRKHVN